VAASRVAWGQLCEQAVLVALREAEFKQRARPRRQGEKEMSSGIKQLTSLAALWQGGAANNPIARGVWIGSSRKHA